MVKHKRNIIAITVCFLLILGVSAYSFAQNSEAKKILDPAFAAQKQWYETLKAEWEKEYRDLLSTSGGKKSLEEIKRRHERELALKQKSGELVKLKQEIDPPTPEELFERKVESMKDAIAILKKTNPEDEIKLNEKLQKVIQIEKDYKEQKKPASELLQELEELSKIKIINEPAKPNPYREIEYIGGNDDLYGFSSDDTSNDTLSGGDGYGGNDTLYGGAASDTMVGGTGNDTYEVDNTGDVVTENANEGTDTVRSSITYTLSANVENLTLTGTAAINGTGNSLNNTITGNSANNTLSGGAGNDKYLISSTGDIVIENADEGIDMVTIWGEITNYTLPENVENLQVNEDNTTARGNSLNNLITTYANNDTLYGGDGNDTILSYYGDNHTFYGENGDDTLTGGDGDDTLYGGTGDDVLIGRDGTDVLYGGEGNDIYFVENSGDTVLENIGEGTDMVYLYNLTSYVLPDNVESVRAYNAAGTTLTGNSLNNMLWGGDGDNTLYGGEGDDLLNGFGGNDTLYGGSDNDTYVINGTGDTVIENSDEGIDRVNLYNMTAYLLTDNVENLYGYNSVDMTLTGNSLDNMITGFRGNDILYGNAGNDTLNGGAGNDTMVGGAGNDTYVVDNAGDVVTENASEGTDTVQSSITYTLGANVENLTLTGTAAINGTGNSLNNVITGNSGNNTLDGGAGTDTLRGGLGDDTYLFRVGSGNDTIESYEGTSGNGVDTLQFQDLVVASIQFSRDNNDLVCTITETGESVRLSNWTLGTNYQVDSLQFSDQTLTAAQVNERIA